MSASNSQTAKQQFDELWEGGTPIERLRFFCSLAMNSQDWLDVEPFFDALYGPSDSDAKDAARYRWLVENRAVASLMMIRPQPISCPDGLEGCLVMHYAAISKSQVDAAIDAARYATDGTQGGGNG